MKPMKIVQLTPGTGSFLCGSCLRDNALVAGLRRAGHEVLMVPLYLPIITDEPATSDGPLFFGGVNTYLNQKLPLLGRAPRAFTQLLDGPRVLRLAASRAGMTRPEDLGALTLSMLRGESGEQAREIERLVAWLRGLPGLEVVCLGNALLLGLARRLREALSLPVVCTLQGEDTFLDDLPSPDREACWRELAERAREVDAFVAVSHYYGARMAERMSLRPSQLHVVHNGILLDGYQPADAAPQPPVLGYLSRMCRQKGLHTLVDAFIRLKQDPARRDLRLRVAGVVTAGDLAFVDEMKRRLDERGLLADAEFLPNIDRAQKEIFLRGLSVLSVPATYGESFGLYVIEALASGVPVVAPRHGAFPELLEATAGGRLCEPDDPASLAEGIAALLDDEGARDEARTLGQRAAHARFGVERMAREVAAVLASVAPSPTPRRPRAEAV